jgi:hypothetical protein
MMIKVHWLVTIACKSFFFCHWSSVLLRLNELN